MKTKQNLSFFYDTCALANCVRMKMQTPHWDEDNERQEYGLEQMFKLSQTLALK